MPITRHTRGTGLVCAIMSSRKENNHIICLKVLQGGRKLTISINKVANLPNYSRKLDTATDVVGSTES